MSKLGKMTQIASGAVFLASSFMPSSAEAQEVRGSLFGLLGKSQTCKNVAYIDGSVRKECAYPSAYYLGAQGEYGNFTAALGTNGNTVQPQIGLKYERFEVDVNYGANPISPFSPNEQVNASAQYSGKTVNARGEYRGDNFETQVGVNLGTRFMSVLARKNALALDFQQQVLNGKMQLGLVLGQEEKIPFASVFAVVKLGGNSSQKETKQNPQTMPYPSYAPQPQRSTETVLPPRSLPEESRVQPESLYPNHTQFFNALKSHNFEITVNNGQIFISRDGTRKNLRLDRIASIQQTSTTVLVPFFWADNLGQGDPTGTAKKIADTF